MKRYKTEDEIREILRWYYIEELGTSEIAEMYGCHPSSIWKIVSGRSFKHIVDGFSKQHEIELKPKQSRKTFRKLKEDKVRQILSDYYGGLSRKEIEEKYPEHSERVIRRLLGQESYRWIHEEFKKPKIVIYPKEEKMTPTEVSDEIQKLASVLGMQKGDLITKLVGPVAHAIRKTIAVSPGSEQEQKLHRLKSRVTQLEAKVETLKKEIEEEYKRGIEEGKENAKKEILNRLLG